MSQYRTGTVTVTNGSQTVTGAGTLWLASVAVGSLFSVAGSMVPYVVGNVSANGTLTLSAPYAGPTQAGALYAITTSFTPLLGLPYMEAGDIDTPTIFKRAMTMIETLLADAYTGLSIAKENFNNAVVNGDLQIWQNGTSFATPASGAYTADQALVTYDGTIGTFTVSRQAHTLGQTAVSGEPKFFWRWAHTAAGSGSTFRRGHWRIEDVRRFAGQTAVLSFNAKADVARTITPKLRQSFGTGGSPSADVDTAATACSLTTAFQKFTRVISVPSISGKTLGSAGNDFLDVFFELPINVTMTIDVSDIDLRLGSIAPVTFERRPPAVELELCERYFQKSFALVTAPVQNAGAGTGEARFTQVVAAATAQILDRINFARRMRATPSVLTLYNPAAANAQARNLTTNADCSATTAGSIDEAGFTVSTTTAAATAAGNAIGVHWSASARL